MGNKVSLEEELINFKLVSKQMQRSSKQCEKKEKAALEKLKQVSEIDWQAFDVRVPLLSSYSCLFF